MIVRIDSTADPAAAAYRHVADHRWLAGQGLFVAEGRLLLERLVRTTFAPLHSVLVSPAALEALTPLLTRLAAPVLVAPQRVLDSIAGLNFHRGCLALAHRPATATPEVVSRFTPILLLEAIGNPDNVGGLFRAAAALGARGVVIDDRTGDPLYRKALRTSMGAVFHMPFARVASIADAAAALRGRGDTVLALTPDSSAAPLDDALRECPSGCRIAVLVGAEGSGLSGEAMASATVKARIPMEPDLDSLNVVVAAAIALSRLRVLSS